MIQKVCLCVLFLHKAVAYYSPEFYLLIVNGGQWAPAGVDLGGGEGGATPAPLFLVYLSINRLKKSS